MARVCVRVLGPARLEVAGAPARLTPLTVRLLIRLVAAGGTAVPVRTLLHDVWELDDRQWQRGKNEVQKRILELRRALDPQQTGEGAQILRTEQIHVARNPESGYRLVLEPEQVDYVHFTALVNTALKA